MRNYTKTYMDYFGYQIAEDVQCEYCQIVNGIYSPCIDVHHVHGRIGKSANSIENLVGLCRNHHNDAHNEIIKKDEMESIHFRFMSRNW